MTARPASPTPRRRSAEGAGLPEIYTTMIKVRAEQMRGANRINEIQDAQHAHDTALLALEERLARIEAKLDQLLASAEPG